MEIARLTFSSKRPDAAWDHVAWWWHDPENPEGEELNQQRWYKNLADCPVCVTGSMWADEFGDMYCADCLVRSKK